MRKEIYLLNFEKAKYSQTEQDVWVIFVLIMFS